MRLSLFFVVLLMPLPALAARLHQAGGEARPQSSPAVPRSPPHYDRGPTGGRYVTPQRDPSTSAGDYNVYPQYIGSAWWSLAQLLTYLPFGLPQDLLEGHGPRAFVYEGKPYGHHGKGIVRTEPLSTFEQRGLESKTGPRMDAEVFQFAPPPTENDWWPGEEVARLQPLDAATGAAENDPIIGMEPPSEYPPLPTLPDNGLDWREGGHTWAAQLQADIAFIDNNTWRVRPRFRLFTPSRFELDGELAYYHESLSVDDQRLLKRTIDWLGMGTGHISYRFAQSQAVQFRAGIGPRFLVTPDDSELGFDTVYSFDAFIHDPLVLSGSIGLGSVGRAFVSDFRIQLGFVFSGVELYGGYEHVQIGHAPLGGPLAGLRYWF
jgi:hypothetical protein